MRALILPAALLGLLAGCAQPQTEFLASKKGAVELRAMQTRLVPGDANTVERGVAATLHDLGYRITKADAATGTLSGTRSTALRMAVAVQPHGPAESVVRANATIVSLRKEAQVDAPDFYARLFFDPLGATLQRSLAMVPDDVAAPEPIRPVAELNTAKDREAAGKPAAEAPATSGTPIPGTRPR